MEQPKSIAFLTWRFTIAIVTITLIVWGVTTISEGPLGLTIGIFGLAAVVLVAGSLWLMHMKNRVDAGEVIHDERSIQHVYKAGYSAFVGSVIMWTFLGSFVDTFDPPRFIIYIGLLGMFVIFGISYLVFRYQASH